MAQQKTSYYHYNPALSATIIFSVAFGLSTIWHTWQLIRRKTWYFIPFMVGGIFESTGYMARALSVQEGPGYTEGPYITQTVLILLAPALYAASIYMILGRLIMLLDAEQYSLVKRKWLTKFFVLGDVVSFVMQGIGGSILSTSDTKSKEDMGKAVLVAGLFVQLVFFGLFIAVAALFHRRIYFRPTTRSEIVQVPWRQYLLVLYGVSLFVMVRSIFRVVEYIQGREGELQSNEVYFYILDTLLMLLVSTVFNIFHPHTIITRDDKGIALMQRNSPSGTV